MLSHPDYHAHLLLLELGFRGIQWLRAMDYEGLLKGVDKQSHHTEQEDVFLCVCVYVLSALQYRITLRFPYTLVSIENLVISRVKEADGHNPTGTAVREDKQTM